VNRNDFDWPRRDLDRVSPRKVTNPDARCLQDLTNVKLRRFFRTASDDEDWSSATFDTATFDTAAIDLAYYLVLLEMSTVSSKAFSRQKSQPISITYLAILILVVAQSLRHPNQRSQIL